MALKLDLGGMKTPYLQVLYHGGNRPSCHGIFVPQNLCLGSDGSCTGSVGIGTSLALLRLRLRGIGTSGLGGSDVLSANGDVMRGVEFFATFKFNK